MNSREEVKRTDQVAHCDGLPEGVLLYTKAQMAAAMQISVRCLTGMMSRGDISYLKIHGRLVRFRPEDALRRVAETSLVWQSTAPKEGSNEQP